jgi:16S rRNA processing protein RimM
VALGRILTPWGARGHIKVQPLTPLRDPFQAGQPLYVGDQRHTVEAARWQGETLYLKLAGLEGRDAAAALRGRYLEVPESDLQLLEEGQYYHYQLIGMAVRSTAGQPLGRLTDIIPTGSNDVFVVRGRLGEVLIPAIDEVVKEVDLEDGVMVVELIPGLMPPQRRRDKR